MPDTAKLSNAITIPEDKTALDPVINAGDPGKQTPDEPILPLDDDDAEYKAAMEALEAEKNGGVQKPNEQDPDNQEGNSQQAPEGKQAEPEPKPVMIPKARLDEVIRERDELKAIAAYQKGVADTANEQLKGLKQPAQGQEQQTRTAQEMLAEIDQKRLDLAAKYDEGEMTLTDLRKQEMDLERQAAGIRESYEAMRLEAIKNQAREEARKDSMQEILAAKTAEIDGQHPALKEITSDHHWAFLRAEASRTLGEQGIVLDSNSAQSQIIFREQIARLADHYVPMWTGKQFPTPESQPKPQNPPAVKTVAQQRSEKIALSHQQPPEAGSIGTQGLGQQFSDAQISRMTDDEIANLPDSVRARLRGG